MTDWYIDGIKAAIAAWSEAQPPRRGWQYLRSLVLESHGDLCSYCGEQGKGFVGPDGQRWHVDHVVPQAKGGRDDLDNLVLACATCNVRKGTKAWQPKFGPLAVQA